jgi:hypothetical protein
MGALQESCFSLGTRFLDVLLYDEITGKHRITTAEGAMKRAMKAGGRCYGRVISAILAVVFLVGCQSLSFDPRGRTVPEAKRIALPQSEDYASIYDNGDFDLAYKIASNQGQTSISGRLRFNERITYNFYIIRYFHLNLIALDADGKVLEMMPLTTVGNLNAIFNDPVEFKRTLRLPSNTAAIAFSYTGQAWGDGTGDGGDVMDFWEYPLY